MTVTIFVGHVLDRLRAMPDESVACVATSGLFYGLRDYGVPATVWGGDPLCRHDFADRRFDRSRRSPGTQNGSLTGDGRYQATACRFEIESHFCVNCGAWRGQLGLEPTYDLYVEHVVEVFREVRRVLRNDGVVWLNVGDSYATGAGKVSSSPGGGGHGAKWAGSSAERGWRGDRLANGRKDQAAILRQKTRATRDGTHAGKHTAMAAMGPMQQPNRLPQVGMKPKDLMMIPARVAIALQADGWWLRDDVIWNKPNPMPESVSDRCTKAHEHFFLLTKSEVYRYDAEAIKEPAIYGPGCGWDEEPKGTRSGKRGKKQVRKIDPEQSFRAIRKLRNKRNVWTVATRPFGGEFCRACQTYFEGDDLKALRVEKIEHKDKTVEHRRHCSCGTWDRWMSHFATFPRKLIEPCILAGSRRGDVVLDVFAGAGTTGMVAEEHGRDSWLVELNPEYAEMMRQRIKRAGGMLVRIVESEPLRQAAE